MILDREYSVNMNIKKITRIKKKFGLITKIRRKSNHKKFSKLLHEHESCHNFLNQDFKRVKEDEVYSTDITQLNYGMSKKAYLSVFKDICTKEIVSSELSTNKFSTFTLLL